MHSVPLCIRTLKAARIWKASFDKLTAKPAFIPRNDSLVKAHERFVKFVRDGNASPESFPDWYNNENQDLPPLHDFRNL